MTTFDRPLVVWTIYERPIDYPQGYVVRPWTTIAGRITAGRAMPAASLGEARAKVPPDLVRLPRMPDEDPVIVESWI